MIHNTFLIRLSTRRVLASTRYWPVEVSQETLEEYVKTREELLSEGSDETDLNNLALVIGEHKFHGAEPVSDILLLFVTDKGESESAIFDKVAAASKTLRKDLAKFGFESIRERYAKIIEPSVTTRLKIALVGEGGVGKTTTLHLLLGDTPPLQYVPTIALNLETVENIRFGNYSLVLWDFAGQERFRMLWRFYFHGADVIFLVCDSALRNVIISKDILKLIKRDAPKVPVFALANKQDKPNAMRPEVVQKILGIPTYPMVAIDKARRDEMLGILMTAAAQYVGVALPDLPASELLKFTATATEEAIAETDAMAQRREAAELKEAGEEGEYEAIEVVEEVLVDESGHVVENPDDYEVVEEVIEEVDEGSIDEAEEEETATSEQSDVALTAEPKEEEADIPISEPGEAMESQALDVEFSDEQLIHRESELIEDRALRDTTESIEALEDAVAQNESEPTEEKVPKPMLLEELELSMERSEISSEIEEVAPSPTIDTPKETEPAEDVPTIEPVIEEDNGDVKLAKDIIFEALQADDFISAEIDLVPHTEIDKALEAFKSDEAVSTRGESETRFEIDEESLKELESILGPLDLTAGGAKSEGSKDDNEKKKDLPIDDETLDELDRLLDSVDSGEDKR